MAETFKKWFSLRRFSALVLALLVIVTMVPQGAVVAQGAAKKPAIATKVTVLQNGTKALSISGNGYTVTKVAKVATSNKAVARATATKSKVKVYGIKKGTAKITVTVKAKKSGKSSTFKLTTKVTVAAPSAKLSKKSLTVGKTAKVTVSNAATGAKVTYGSSKKSVATVSAKGVVTAKAAGSAKITAKVVLPKTKYAKKKTVTLAAGTVKVTAASTGGDNGTDTPDPGTDTPDPGTDTPVVESTEKTAATQAEIDAALASSKLTKLTVNTTDNTTFTLSGDHKTVDLVVNAQNATIDNSATWKGVEIQAIKDNTWIERAIDNIFRILAPKARLVAAAGAKIANITVATTGTKAAGNAVKIEAEAGAEIAKVAVDTSAANVEVKADGTGKVAEVEVAAANADVSISGTSTAGTKVTVDASATGADITASSKVEVTTAANNVDVKLESGAAGSTVASTDASAQVKVENSTGSNVTVTDSTGKNTTVSTGQTSTTSSSGTTTTGSTSSSSSSSSSSSGGQVTPASSFTYTITVSEVTTGSGTVTATVSGESIKLQRGEQNEYVLVVSGGSYKVKTGTLSKVSSIKYNGSEVPYRAINADALEALLTTGNTKGYGTGTYTVVTTSQIAGFATNTELKAQADIANFLIGLDAIASTPISQGSTSGS